MLYRHKISGQQRLYIAIRLCVPAACLNPALSGFARSSWRLRQLALALRAHRHLGPRAAGSTGITGHERVPAMSIAIVALGADRHSRRSCRGVGLLKHPAASSACATCSRETGRDLRAARVLGPRRERLAVVGAAPGRLVTPLRVGAHWLGVVHDEAASLAVAAVAPFRTELDDLPGGEPLEAAWQIPRSRGVHLPRQAI